MYTKFKERDFALIYFKRAHFSPGKYAKLKPKIDGPSKVLQRIRENVYKIELPESFGI